MNSLFALIFLKLTEHLQRTVPEVKFIDLDIGQLENYDGRPAVAWPCVLIDFTDSQYSDEHQGVQWWAGSIDIRLGFAPFSNTNGLTPDAVKYKGLNYLEIENKVYKALQGYDADGLMQPMTRVRAVTEQRDDSYRVRMLSFTSATEDKEAAEEIKRIAADLQIDDQLIKLAGEADGVGEPIFDSGSPDLPPS